MFKVTVEGQSFEASANETILQAAERSSFLLPQHCRVGSCGQCQCRVLSGAVQPLTDPTYTLEKKAITENEILLCQSRAKSDLSLHYSHRTYPVVRRAAAPISTILPDVHEPQVRAKWWDYLKFSSHLIIGITSAMALLLGGMWISACLCFVIAFYVLGDRHFGHDHATVSYEMPRLLDVQLYASLPVMVLVIVALLWQFSPNDVLGIGKFVMSFFSLDILGNKANSGWGSYISGLLLTGLMIGMIATIPAHELIHRTWHRTSMFVGRWLLAFSFDTSFSVEHVYGHHRYVATSADPATAPRGRSVYRHILRSTWEGNKSAWKIEQKRLRRLGYWAFSWHNRVLRGYLMSLALVLVVGNLFGWFGVLTFSIAGSLGKCMLEIVNYMEHYGLVRVPGQPVAPRHSWNCTQRLSSWSMYQLTRHSHHHAQGEVPFYKLHPLPDAPHMITGYLGTLLLTLIPPLWFRLMQPKLACWDEQYATMAERKLLQRKNNSM